MSQLVHRTYERQHYVEFVWPSFPDPFHSLEFESEHVGFAQIAKGAPIADHQVGLLRLEAIPALWPRNSLVRKSIVR